jgi:hypothetical protein
LEPAGVAVNTAGHATNDGIVVAENNFVSEVRGLTQWQRELPFLPTGARSTIAEVHICL